MNALLRADTAARANYYMTAIQNGWMVANEVRAIENMNYLDGGWQRITPANMLTDEEREKNIEMKENNDVVADDTNNDDNGTGTENI